MGDEPLGLRNVKEIFDKWFILVFLVSILFRQIWFLSLIERDEGGIALGALQWMRGFLPYASSFNNPGPLAYIIYLSSTIAFGPGFLPIRMVNNAFFFLSIIFMYSLARYWLSRRVALLSSLLYGIFMSAPIYEGQLALTSSLSAPMIVFSGFFCSSYLKNHSKKALCAASFVLGGASLIKGLVAPGLFLLLGMIPMDYLYQRRKDLHMRKMLGDLLAVVLGFSILPTIFIIYFAQMGILNDLFDVFINRTLIGYQGLPDVPFGITFYVIAQGLPLWLFAVLGFVVVSNRRSKFDLFVVGWLIFSAGMAMFPPHFGHRYVYLVAPASILAGIGISRALSNLKPSVEKGGKGLTGRHVKPILLAVLLLLSSSFALVFQADQYPQYDINSSYLNFQWGYADSDSYSSQVRIGDFLRSNSSTGSQVLVHGWAPEIYYLADKLPPSKYVWTRPAHGVFSIPENEYSHLVESVKNHEFEYVVLFDTSLAALEFRKEDAIVVQVLSEYFYVGSIGNGMLFSKYDSAGRLVYYDFIENFWSASKIYFAGNATPLSTEEDFKDEPIFIPKISILSINGDERYAIFHHPLSGSNSSVAYTTFVPKNSTLEFGIGVDPNVWGNSGDGVEFIVEVENENSTRMIFHKYMDPKNILQDREWFDVELNMSAYSEKEVTISFIVLPGPNSDNRFDWAYWGRPIIVAQGK